MDYSVPYIYGKIKNKSVTVDVPSSKSITARALMMAALADGVSTLNARSLPDDCTTFISALGSLGISVKEQGAQIKVYGYGGVIPKDRAEVYVGSAGTAARFITAALAFSEGEYELTASPQMTRRPLKDLILALQDIGAEFTFRGEEYCFPFKIRGTGSPRSEVKVDITKSSQFLSALLMAGVLAKKPFKIATVGSHGMDYVNMTLDMMWSFGVDVLAENGVYTVSGSYAAKQYDIEPDVSSACYFYALNRLLDTNVRVAGLMPHTAQGDRKFIELIKNFDGGEVDMSAFSDQALTLAAIAPYFNKPTHIFNIGHIRGQECDRIAAIVKNLAAMGIECDEEREGVTIYPGKPHGAEIETFGDHRVAMAFAVAGLRCGGVTVKDAQVCSKTFKDFFAVLDKLVADLTR